MADTKPPPSDSYVIRHMNEDHADSLLAYAKHYGKVPHATHATLTHINLTSITLNITDADTKQHTVTIPFTAPLTSTSEYRSALTEMSNRAMEALHISNTTNATYYRRPNIPISTAILIGLTLNYWAAYRQHMPHPMLEPIKEFALKIFQSQGMIQCVFLAAIAAHIFETSIAYGELNKKGVTDSRVRMIWLIQTFLLGYPSLKLLKELKAPAKQV